MKSLRIELIEKGISDARAGGVKQNGSKARANRLAYEGEADRAVVKGYH